MRKCAQLFGLVFLLLTVALLLTALLTNYWTVITVRLTPSSKDSQELAYYSRNRGVYRECWLADPALDKVIQVSPYYYSEGCLRLDTRLLNINQDVVYGNHYRTRAGLLVAFWVLMAVTGLLLLLALMFTLYSLCHHITTYQWKNGCKASAGLMFAAVFFHIFAMALFHGAEHMELNIVRDPSGVQAPYRMFFAKDIPDILAENSRREYGWSYALSWLAVGCAILSACLFTIVSCMKKLKPKKVVYAQPAPTNTGTASRNPTYDTAENKLVLAPPQVYIVQSDDYYQRGQRAHYNPYATGDYRSAYSPQYNYERGWQMNGSL